MADADTPRRPGLLDSAVRIFLLFQAFVAGLATLIIGLNLYWSLDDAYYPPGDYGPEVYPALRQLFLAVLTAMTTYILVIQWNCSNLHADVTAKLELAKGLLATATWLWLLLDFIFYIPVCQYRWGDPYDK
ncbi:hypothetical protein Daus18300_013535, partial [Diaporthe australafricana]